MSKRKCMLMAVFVVAAMLFMLTGINGAGVSYVGDKAAYAASSDNRTGVYQANYTANGKTTTEWCYLKDGKVQYSYTGFASNSNGWWYVEKGKVTFKKNDVISGTVKGQSGWWFVKGSKVQFVDSVEQNSNGWWVIRNGKADFNYTGFASNANGWWYAEKGKVSLKKTDIIQGTVKGQTGWWYVKNSRVQFVNSVEQNSNGWWAIKNGMVDFNFNGIASNANGWWYCKGGKVIFDYNGYLKFATKGNAAGGTVTIKNGKVTGNDGKGNIAKLISSSSFIDAGKTITSLDGKYTVSMDGWKKIYVYSWNDDFYETLKVLLNQYPELKNYVQYVDLKTDSNSDDYISKVDKALKSGTKYPSIIASDIDGANYWMDDNSKTAALSAIGLQDSMFTEAYDFSKQFATYNGELKAATWQGCPGVFIYRRDIAQSVFGVSDPADVQKLLKDWDSFFAAAKKLKKAGKYIVSGPDEIKYAALSNREKPWITSTSSGKEKLTLDSSVTQYLKYFIKLYDGGYTKNTSTWSEEWNDNMSSNDVFGYFGTTWFTGILEGNCGKSFGKWGVCTGPSPYNWGGTYLMVGKNTPNPDLSAFIIYGICCDSKLMYKITTEKGDFVNNRTANAKLVKDKVSPKFSDGKSMVKMLGGQNPIQAWADAAERIDLSNKTYADITIMECIDNAAWAYVDGDIKTVDEAVQLVIDDAKNELSITD